MSRTITIVGLGAGDLDQLTLGVYRLLQKTDHLYVRTKDHPAVEELQKEEIHMTFFDDIYEKHDGFEAVYREITSVLFEKALEDDIVYAVPGHPLVAEQTVQILLKEAGGKEIQVKVAGGKSFLDEMYTALKIDPIEGCQILDGTSLKKEQIQVRNHLIIVQVYDGFIASDVKLTLMDKYPDDFEVAVVTAAGSTSESVHYVPLHELDRSVELNNLTAVYVPPVRDDIILLKDFEHLRGVIATLRGPDGCPWDKKQTNESLKRYLIEEAYEVIEAIDEEDDEHLVEELGDVLLQVLLHAQIGEDEGYFSIDDVISVLAEKMIRRHPHVFGDVEAETADQVLKNWEEIKSAEKGNAHRTSLLDGVAKGLPALHKAYDYQKKAAKAGFDWDEITPVIDKLREEFDEWKTAQSDEERKKEFGDMLFTMVNLGRFYGIHPEEALSLTNQKFYQRFRYIETELAKEGLTPQDTTLEKMDKLWDQAKENL
ncbi:nucleoside triphosphate pyrophosphohydrolase [Fictibacillus enclensis]|uniref:nucleoside triphosphate pyrophosphohydrolase n=1 Tax=Fictibacillus enclensis TaxID=1017270 RepID=UPI0025A07BB8|nr:nucleoside triphosphate pyrophosphohydrolase [Fictibacillus enclensis]MDM5196838.1 nucleoside triphosphate pyrophosphohydrolase [Fictibacillus enclensis]